MFKGYSKDARRKSNGVILASVLLPLKIFIVTFSLCVFVDNFEQVFVS